MVKRTLLGWFVFTVLNLGMAVVVRIGFIICFFVNLSVLMSLIGAVVVDILSGTEVVIKICSFGSFMVVAGIGEDVLDGTNSIVLSVVISSIHLVPALFGVDSVIGIIVVGLNPEMDVTTDVIIFSGEKVVESMIGLPVSVTTTSSLVVSTSKILEVCTMVAIKVKMLVGVVAGLSSPISRWTVGW